MLPSYPPEDLARHEEGFLNSADHLRLFWQRYTPPAARATVLVLHGAGDHSGRYPGVTSALVRARFQVALLDYRGHGQSDGRRWHIDAFGDYLSDFEVVHEKLKADQPSRPRFVVAHSQGALVAALWGIGREREVAGFVLSSPFFGFAIKPPLLKDLGARLVGKVVPWLPVSTGLAFDSLTSDEELQGWTARDHLYSRSTTPRWFVEAKRAQVEALRRAGEFKGRLLVLAAGADPVADLGATRRWVEAAGSAGKRLSVYEGFRHEIFNERERARPIGEAVEWLSAQVV